MDFDQAVILTKAGGCAAEVRQALRAFNPFLTVVEIDPVLQMERIGQILSAGEPLVVFIDADDPELAAQCAAEIYRAGGPTRTIAVYHQIVNTAFLDLRRQGVRECVQIPDVGGRLQEVLKAFLAEGQSAAQALEAGAANTGCFLSFVPAKPGAGASTAAAHFAHFAAEQIGARVALIDLDMNCGVQGLMARSDRNASIVQAAQYAGRMEDSIWDRLVTQAGAVDVLPATHRSLNTRIDTERFEHLLHYLRRRYPLAVFDHSGNMERYSVTVLQRSARIFSVCAPDLSTVHQAGRAMELFDELQLRSKVAVLMTRDTAATGLGRGTVLSMLGVQPVGSLPNAFSSLQTALIAGGLAGRNSPYGRAMRRFVDAVLAGQRVDARTTSRGEGWGGLRSAFSRLRSSAAPAR